MKSGAAPRSDTLRIPQRWPLMSVLQDRTSATPLQADARLINAYVEFDPEDEEYWIYKRLGLASTSVFGPGASTAGRGIYTYAPMGGSGTHGINAGSPALPTSGVVFGVWGGTLSYSVTQFCPATGASASVGTLTGVSTANMAFFETINSNPQVVVVGVPGAGGAWILGGLTAAINSGTAATLTKITDSGFPANAGYPIVPGWAYLDGTLYVMDVLGNIWNSAINAPSVWSPATSIQASSNADSGVALVKQLNYIIALKQWTAQVFYDAGNTSGSPLSVVPDTQMPWGCTAAGSVAQIDNTILWMTSNQTVSPQIVRMDNLEPRIISTPAVERLLDEAMQTVSPPTLQNYGIWSWTLKHGGHRWYALTLATLNITLVYDLDQPGAPKWYPWSDVNGNYWPVVGVSYIPAGFYGAGFTSTQHLAQHATAGYVYPLDGCYVYPTDSGVVFPVDIYTPNFDGGTTRRKYLKALYPYADRTAGSILQMRHNDYDFDPTRWSNFRSCDLGLEKPRFMDCGTFDKRRALHFRHQCPTAFRIKSVDMALLWGML